MIFHQAILDRLQVTPIQLRICRTPPERLKQCSGRCFLRHAGWCFPRKQTRQKVSPVERHFENRFIYQVLDHVLASNVKYESHLRLKSSNVCKVLLRTDAEINAARFPILFQPWNHILKQLLVRHVFESERTAFLGEVRHQSPKGVVTQLARQSIRGGEGRDDEDERAEQNNDHSHDVPPAIEHIASTFFRVYFPPSSAYSWLMKRSEVVAADSTFESKSAVGLAAMISCAVLPCLTIWLTRSRTASMISRCAITAARSTVAPWPGMIFVFGPARP